MIEVEITKWSHLASLMYVSLKYSEKGQLIGSHSETQTEHNKQAFIDLEIRTVVGGHVYEYNA